MFCFYFLSTAALSSGLTIYRAWDIPPTLLNSWRLIQLWCHVHSEDLMLKSLFHLSFFFFFETPGCHPTGQGLCQANKVTT